MPSPIGRRESLASYEPDDHFTDEPSASSRPQAACYDEARRCDDTLRCDVARPAELEVPPSSTLSGAPDTDERPTAPDYVTLSVGAGAIIGADVAATLDRNGRLYLGVGAGIGASLTVGSVTLMAGQLLSSDATARDDKHLRSFMEGNSVGALASFGGAAGVTNTAAGTATEIGVGLAQAGAQFQHSWHILQLPLRW